MRLTYFQIPIVFIFSACSLGPEYERPDLKLAQNYSIETAEQENIVNLNWWDLFKDPDLQHLIRTALENNKDLELAFARIEESNAILDFTRADQLPRVDLSGNVARIGPSQEFLAIALAPRNNFSLLANLSFELDLWGKLRNATAAQKSILLSNEYNYRALTISLLSQVANLYFRLLDIDQRLIIAERTLKSRKHSVSIIGARHEKGVTPLLDVNQAEIEMYTAEVSLAALEREHRMTENALNLLLGQSYGEIKRSPAGNNLINNVPIGFPADLLERRPDIKASEELTRAAVAAISVAEANRLPSLSLIGFIGYQSNSSSNFLQAGARSWSIGNSLLGPLIDFGKTASAAEAATARAEQQYRLYEQTVLTAVREVEDALISVKTMKAEYESRTRQVTSANSAATLSRARYDNGVTSYLEVLDLERSLFNAELQASETKQRYLNSIVQLYKALGGGWTNDIESNA